MLHEARNTTATLLVEAGVDPKIIKAILGHSSIVTSRGYLHVNQDSPPVRKGSTSRCFAHERIIDGLTPNRSAISTLVKLREFDGRGLLAHVSHATPSPSASRSVLYPRSPR